MYKIVLIGAGSTQFGLGTVGDIFKSKILINAAGPWINEVLSNVIKLISYDYV